MAAATTILAAAALATAAVGTYQQMEAAKDAQSDRNRAFNEQKKAASEQKAMNAQQEAAARRQAIREERVKRARVIQSATGSGLEMGSGESGAVGSLSTQLGGNLGFLSGQNNAATRISDYGQAASNFLSSAENKMVTANMWGGVSGLSMSIFGQAGGFNSLGFTKAPTKGP